MAVERLAGNPQLGTKRGDFIEHFPWISKCLRAGTL
jgi:hypothetical protein